MRRRRVPALELLDATLSELRHGLTESAARSVAYELFEKLGYGAVAVTDLHQVLAFVGAPLFIALVGMRDTALRRSQRGRYCRIVSSASANR